MSEQLDQQCVNTVRFLSVDMVQKAGSGHPGLPLGAAPMAYVGQGMANAVGLAMAEAQLAARYNRLGHVLIDHYTYALVSDGDLMEGVGAQAVSLAGHLRLGKLICLYDDNYVTLSAGTDITFTEDRAARFRACGWHTIQVDDGNDLGAIDSSLTEARENTLQPSLILIRTHIGYGSPEQDSYKAHGSPLGVEDVRRTKERLNWPTEPAFLVPDAALAHFRAALDRGAKSEADWNNRLSAYTKAFSELALELKSGLRGELPAGWNMDIPVFAADAKGVSTREASGQIMNAIAPKLLMLTGGSAYLDPSTKTALKGFGNFNPPLTAGEDAQGSEGGGWSFAGRNLHFGVREHAMGAIVNGVAAHGGMLACGATFLIFSDYMRPAIRLAALSRLHVIHVFTHDSIALGEDGPTHQPIEQLANLRAIPNLTLLRPGDANETAVAWQIAIEMTGRPVLLVLSRQAVPTLDRTFYASAQGVRRGAYVLKDAADGKPQIILIASGSEVGLIVVAADRLRQEGIAARCVSMPSWDLFDALPKADRDAVLPPSVRARLAVEAGATQGWHRYVGDGGDVIGVDRFGASAPGKTVLCEYGFTVDNVCLRAKALLS